MVGNELAQLRARGHLPAERAFGLNVMGVSTDQAKVNFWRHERLPLLPAYLVDPDLPERLRMGLAWADEVLQAPEIVAIIDADNRASIRVAEKCGFNENEPATYRGEPILLFRRKG